MNKYLIEILKIQSSVILPGLGALMVPSQKSGKIVFNPHLKFNDGSLARFIAEKEGIDAQESQNKVAKFVREIEAELGKGNSYDMFQFGNFFKNKDGEVDFIMAGTPAKAETNTPKTDPVITPPIEKKEEKEKTQKEEKKKESKTSKKEKSDKTETAEEKKQTKNKFVPPVVEKVKEEVTKAVEKTEEKAKEKIEDKKSSIEKGIGALVHDAKDKVESVKEKISPEADKKPITPPVIADSKADDKNADDKQSKNTFVPPVKDDAKKETSASKVAPIVSEKVSSKAAEVKASVADKTTAKNPDENKSKAAAIVTAAGSAASTASATASATGKTITEKTKETLIVKEEKKKRSKLPWIILLLLLIGLAVAGYFFKDKIMAFIDGDDAVAADPTATSDTTLDSSNILPVEYEDSLGTASSDTLDSVTTDMDGSGEFIEDSMDNTETVEDPVEEIAPAVSGSNNGSYHLIGNSFGEEANAERYVKQMQAKGYPAKVLGRFDGLYMVSLKSYDSRDAAQSGRNSVSADASSAWIFKYAK